MLNIILLKLKLINQQNPVISVTVILHKYPVILETLFHHQLGSV